MLTLRNKDGFASFLEVIISAMIFIIAGFGIFTAISTLTPQTKETSSRFQAALMGKNMLDTIYKDIDATDWNDCDGIPPDGPLCVGETTATQGAFTIKKTVTNEPGTSGLRKVTLTITYPVE